MRIKKYVDWRLFKTKKSLWTNINFDPYINIQISSIKLALKLREEPWLYKNFY